ncbi:MAG: hypothetical protein NUV65_06895 [Candidatus Roizmanbacteria bacterium]|nr:hypothetical protein [Candidatus Roizmanbacteria bacterium]
MYTVTNYPTKKALIADVKAGKEVRVYQPGPWGPDVQDGKGCIEGPHYPKPHKWYAEAVIKDGRVVKAK